MRSVPPATAGGRVTRAVTCGFFDQDLVLVDAYGIGLYRKEHGYANEQLVSDSHPLPQVVLTSGPLTIN